MIQNDAYFSYYILFFLDIQVLFCFLILLEVKKAHSIFVAIAQKGGRFLRKALRIIWFLFPFIPFFDIQEDRSRLPFPID